MFTRTITILALALVAGCSNLFGPDEPGVSVSLQGEAGHLDRVSALLIDVAGRDFRVEPGDQRQVEAPREGTLTVRIALLGPAADTRGAISFRQEFDENDNHWIAGIVGLERPVGMCIGRLLTVPLAVPSQDAVPDTLFVMHGSIPKGAIC